MNFTVNRAALAVALSNVIRANKNNSTQYDTVLLTALPDCITVACTDGRVGIIETVPANLTAEGSALLPASAVLRIVKSISPRGAHPKDFTVQVFSRYNYVSIITGHSKHTIKEVSGIWKIEIPEFSDDIAPIPFDFPLLRDVFRRVVFACSQDEFRPALTGVCIHCNKERSIKIAATNAHILAQAIFYDLPKFYFNEFILPANAAKLIAGLRVPKDVQHSEMRVFTPATGGSYTEFRTGRTRIVAMNLQETFPPYQKIIPTKFAGSMTFFRSMLLTALQSAKLCAGYNRVVKFTVGYDKATITANDSDAEFSSAEQKLPVTATGIGMVDFVFGFDADYIIDTLRHFNSEYITLLFNAPTEAFILTETDVNADYIQVIMPVRL